AHLTEEMLRSLTMIAALPAAVLMIFAPIFFGDIFGSDWATAGVLSAFLAPALYMQFVSSPLSQIFAILQRPQLTMVFNGILFVLRAAGLWAGAYFGDVVLAVALF